MSEQKPKKDLRARLGRTIAPNTPGAPPIAAPGGVIAPPPSTVAAPAPAAASPAAAPAASAHAPAAVAPPAAAKAQPAIAAPPAMASRNAFGGADIAPPPFAKPAEAPRPSQPPKADPFAAGPAVQQVIRIAADERPVDEAEVGRRQGGRVFLVIGVSLVAGAAMGFGIGGTYERNVLYNTVVRDGQGVYTAVDETSRTVLEAQTQLEALATAAGGGPSGHPSVDYTALTALNGIANPLQASHFSDRAYHLFQAGAVDDLFTYYNNVQLLWDRFRELQEIAAGPADGVNVTEVAATAVCPMALPLDADAARAAIAAAAEATTAAASAQYVGALSTGADGTVRVALRFAEPELDATTHEPTGHILMRAAPTDTATPIELWTPETPITATPTHAIVINSANSAGVLSERLGAFRTYVTVLQETRTLMTATIEVQGRLTTSLGDIARLEQTF
jgi:hypothetical protein